MNSATDLAGDSGGSASMPRPVASWYTNGRSDGLGDRLLMFDNTATGALELLRLRPELSDAPGFEGALRARVEQLEPFVHPAFSRTRAVERLEGDERLALVSTHTPGRRLSEILDGPQAGKGTHPAFAVWLIRELTAALADLHAQGAGIAHGALDTDRIVLTPEGQLVIVEHALGGALDALHLPPGRLWAELGVLALPNDDGTLHVDARGDVVQLGLVALSLLLGRRVTPAEYPGRLGSLLDEFSARADARAPALVPPLRQWLTRALLTDSPAFASALDARDGLRILLEPLGPQALESLHASQVTVMRSLPDTSMSNTPARDAAKSVPPAKEPAARPWTTPEPVILNADAPAAWIGEDDPAPIALGAASTSRTRDSFAVHAPSESSGFLTQRNLAVMFGAVALVEAVGVGFLLMTRPAAPRAVPTPPPASLAVTIDSPTPGEVVMVDGRQAGVTPLALTVTSSVHAIRVLGAVAPAVVGPAATPARSADPRPKAQPGPSVAADARPTSGGLRITSPIELQVIEGERVLGSSATGPIVLSAGAHQLDLLNSALGYRAKETVQIKAGQVLPLRVQPPGGRISINALPWAQVWIDGTSVGETPLANLPLTIGEHEIVFRHPQLGERRETAVVKSDALTRVSTTMGR